MARRVVLDCDTGTDDAVAIMLAALHPGLDLVGVTTVWGNADVEVTTENTLRVLQLVGRADVPVLRGAEASSSPPTGPPGGRQHRTAYLDLPPATGTAGGQPAAEWLVDTLRTSTQPLTLAATGPLTNIAAALALDPRLSDVVEEVVVMGGAHRRAGVTASAERNFWNDARAARAVLGAGLRRVVLVTLDATYAAALDSGHATALSRLGTPAGATAAAFLEQRIAHYASVPDMRGRGAAPVHDALAVAYLAERSLLRLRHLHVAVAQGGENHGRSVIDVDRLRDNMPNAHVALEADGERYADVLLRTFARAP